MQISCIAIDDEPLALSKLEGFISKVADLKLIGTFDNAIEAIGWLKENRADLIFLDIQMEQLTGIQFLEATGSKSRVVLTTAYDQYALKGYELNVTDYLLKPFSFQRFLQAVNKVMEYYSQITDANKTISGSESFIFVKTEYRLERIDIDSILYIEGMKDYLRIICNDKKIMTLQSFAKIEDSLPTKISAGSINPSLWLLIKSSLWKEVLFLLLMRELRSATPIKIISCLLYTSPSPRDGL